MELIKAHRPNAEDVLDVPAGNGIATYALAKAGFDVVAVEPDPSPSVGRGAIASTLAARGLPARIVAAFGENLPFETGSFDVVYVRQGLHHAHDLSAMLREYARVLRRGGLLLGCREHVVDNYETSLRDFLASQVDHQLYGGEHAFTLADYRCTCAGAGLTMIEENSGLLILRSTSTRTPRKVLSTKSTNPVQGKNLGLVLSRSVVGRLGMWRLRGSNRPGRLYSFVARAP